MKKLVVLLLVSLMATSAFAVIDPDPDGIGVYFDMTADAISTSIPANLPFFAYVTITNPSYSEVHGLEFGYRIVVPDGMGGMLFRLANILPIGSIDLGTSTDVLAGDYIVGLAEPLPASEAVQFVTWQFMQLAQMPMAFFIGGSSVPSLPEGGPAYEIGGSIAPLQQSTGGPLTAVAVVNTDIVPVAIEQASFGSVKSLFR